MTSDDSRFAKPGRKRSENRKMFTEQVSLIQQSDTQCLGPKSEDRSIECVTVNASNSGVSIYSEKPLQSGSRFIIYSGKIWDVPKHGIVMWCKKIASGLYRAGIMLDQKKAEPAAALLCAEKAEIFKGPDKKNRK